MPRRKPGARDAKEAGKKAGSRKPASGRNAGDAIKPVRLAHWRADGSPKVRYRTEAEAHKAGFGFRLEHGTELHAYECEFCGGWHLGAGEER
jgi:hypothetical protein